MGNKYNQYVERETLAYIRSFLPEEKIKTSSLPKLIPLSSVEPEDVSWLWRPYLPFGKVSIAIESATDKPNSDNENATIPENANYIMANLSCKLRILPPRQFLTSRAEENNLNNLLTCCQMLAFDSIAAK
jgi:hypothetical protein